MIKEHGFCGTAPHTSPIRERERERESSLLGTISNYYSDNIVQYIHTLYYYYSTQSNELNAIALTVVEDIPRSLLQ
jgi:hypothetical protein